MNTLMSKVVVKKWRKRNYDSAVSLRHILRWNFSKQAGTNKVTLGASSPSIDKKEKMF